MPGSKRRALKKLLSPQSTPVDNAGSPTEPASLPEAASFSSLASSTFSNSTAQSQSQSQPIPQSLGGDPNDQSASSQQSLLNEMQSRETDIGSGTHLAEDGIGSLSINDTNGSVPSVPAPIGASSSPPPAPTGGMYGKQLTAEALAFGNGGEGGKKKKKSSKQRFAERQARKQQTLFDSAPPPDPAWNEQLERERQDEIRVIKDACDTLGCELYEIAPDGHCMFNAIGDQLQSIGLIPGEYTSDPRFIRKAAAEYMLAHPDDFMPFLPSVTGEDSEGATDDGMMTEAGFKKYCALVADTGEWGGEPEIQALSRAFKVPIHVIQRGPPTIVSHGGSDDSFGGATTPEQSLKAGNRVVRISYHKRMYGLGEHYNSLRNVA